MHCLTSIPVADCVSELLVACTSEQRTNSVKVVQRNHGGAGADPADEGVVTAYVLGTTLLLDGSVLVEYVEIRRC